MELTCFMQAKWVWLENESPKTHYAYKRSHRKNREKKKKNHPRTSTKRQRSTISNLFVFTYHINLWALDYICHTINMSHLLIVLGFLDPNIYNLLFEYAR